MKLSNNRTEADLLKRALLGNAVFSAICGLLIIVFDTRIVAMMTDLQHHLWPLGLMLLGFHHGRCPVSACKTERFAGVQLDQPGR